MRIIAVANQKGGCGKTTTAINLSASLAFLGKKTLLVDLDPQGHSTLGLGYQIESFEKSLYDVLSPRENQVPLEDVILRASENHHLVPSHVILSAIEQQLAGVYGREEKLMEKLNPIRNQYDFAIIDCPPNLGLLTFNALRAADELLIPVEPSYFSMQGLKKIRETVSLIEETLKHHISVHALLTLYNNRSNFNQKILAELQVFFRGQLLKTIVRQNVRLREAAEAGKSICDFDRKSVGFHDYVNLASEIIERGFPQYSGVVKETLHEEEQAITSQIESRVHIKDGFDIPFDPEINISAEVENTFLAIRTDPFEVLLKTGQNVFNNKYPMFIKDAVVLGFSDPKAKLVQVAGDFNNWVNESMEQSDEDDRLWKKTISLLPGRYRYKFIVDGDWTVDPQNHVSEPNPYGGIDSVIVMPSLSEEIIDERSSKI